MGLVLFEMQGRTPSFPFKYLLLFLIYLETLAFSLSKSLITSKTLMIFWQVYSPLWIKSASTETYWTRIFLKTEIKIEFQGKAWVGFPLFFPPSNCFLCCTIISKQTIVLTFHLFSKSNFFFQL